MPGRKKTRLRRRNVCRFCLERLPILSLLLTTVLDKTLNVACVSMLGVDIVLSLFPMVVTVVGVSLGLGTREIYGLTYGDLNAIRKGFGIGVFEEFVISIALIAVLPIFETFHCTISVYILYLVSIFYSGYFLNQELCVLLKRESFFEKLFIVLFEGLNENKNISMRDKKYKDRERETIFLQCYVSENGIDHASDVLATDNKWPESPTLSLLQLANQYLSDALQNLSNVTLITMEESYRGCKLTDIVKQGFDSLEKRLLRNSAVRSAEGSEKELPVVANALVNNLVLLRNICIKMGMVKKANEKLNHLFFYLAILDLQDGLWKSNNLQAQFLLRGLLVTLNDEETWFFDCCIDESILSYWKPSFLCFVAILLVGFGREKNDLGREGFVGKLFDRPNKAKRTLRKRVRSYIEGGVKQPVSLLENFLSIYDWLGIKTTIRHDEYVTYTPLFLDTYILDSWLGIVLQDSCDDTAFEDDALNNLLSGLSWQRKNDYRIHLNTVWHDQKTAEFRNNGPLFVRYILEDSDIVVLCRQDTNLGKALHRFLDSFYWSDLDLLTSEENNQTSDLLKTIEEDLKAHFEMVGLLPFCVSTPNANLTNKAIFSATLSIEKHGSEALLRLGIDSLFPKIGSWILRQAIHGKGVPEKMSLQAIEQSVEDMKAIFLTDMPRLLRVGAKRGDIERLYAGKERIHLTFDDELMCFAKDAFRFSFDCTKTEVRKLQLEEIEKRIDDNFEQIRGMYRYARYDWKGYTVYLNREQLRRELSERYLVVELNILLSMESDLERILVVKPIIEAP